MKFSENWLRTFVTTPLTSAELADALTMGGIEVEAMERAAPAFERVVVAEVLDVQKHPDADRLTVCSVSAGGAPLQVVCGAPNVREGLTVVWLPPGSTVPESLVGGGDPFVLSARPFRGQMSNGMLASQRELSLGDNHEGILEIVVDGDETPPTPGTDFAEYTHLACFRYRCREIACQESSLIGSRYLRPDVVYRRVIDKFHELKFLIWICFCCKPYSIRHGR